MAIKWKDLKILWFVYLLLSLRIYFFLIIVSINFVSSEIINKDVFNEKYSFSNEILNNYKTYVIAFDKEESLTKLRV